MKRLTDAGEKIIVALDGDRKGSLALAESLAGSVAWVKVGMTLFYEAGPSVVTQLQTLGFRVFVDLKLHDIPHQVRGAAERLGELGAGMLTVHASGGPDMIAAAVQGAMKGAAEAGVEKPAVIAVTVLTSMDQTALSAVGIGRTPAAQVDVLAAVAHRAGCDGVVCSPEEAAGARALFGDVGLVVTPGVRPSWSGSDDQARVATPTQAITSGASHVVIGRPITAAPDPVEAAKRIIQEMEDTIDV
jgi:orotidine-5'-phosphate decarboxylase